MVRPLRIEYPGAVYHVTSRGDRREPIAKDDTDRVMFLEVLGQALNNATNIPYSSSRVAHWYKENDPQGLFELRTLHAQHHAILRAIKARDGYRAETLMRGHIAGAADGIRKQLSATTEEAAYAVADHLRTVA